MTAYLKSKQLLSFGYLNLNCQIDPLDTGIFNTEINSNNDMPACFCSTLLFNHLSPLVTVVQCLL